MKSSWWSLEVVPWWGRILVGRRPAVTLIRLAVLTTLCVLVFHSVFRPVKVSGDSMEPAYPRGRVCFMNRWAYRTHTPRRGDVVFIRKEGTILVIMKRVVGLPGERVAVRRSRVYVDGERLSEPYAKGWGIPPTPGVITLGPDEYFTIGDNRDVTAYDVARRQEILGKVIR